MTVSTEPRAVELLGRLAATPSHLLRLSRLAAEAGLSLSRVSRIVDVLEDVAGCVHLRLLAGKRPLASPTTGPRPGCEYGAVSRSVLVVDDDAVFRRLVTGMLADWGHVVIGEAAGVEEALARAVELRPDTALVDVGLPDGDGFSLTRQLRAMPWPLRVVLISTDADGASEPAARRAGASGFLPKSELSGLAFRHLIEGA